MMTRQPKIRLYKFAPGWAAPLPTAGPFALKLETWFRIAGLEYDSTIENDARKGPKQKSPWIDDRDARLADSELIVEHLIKTRGVDPDARLDPAARGAGLAWRRLFEEHFHQAWEHAIFARSDGAQNLALFLESMALPLRAIASYKIRSSLRKQLFARGLGRHDDATIDSMANADLDAADAWLVGRQFFLGDEPTTTDATTFAFLALSLFPAIETPLHAHARTLRNVRAYCERMIARFFPEAAKLIGAAPARAA